MSFRCCPRSPRSFLALALGALLAAAPGSARADGPSPAPGDAAEVARMNTAAQVTRTNWVPPGSHERYGHAEVILHAPLAKVRALVLDFPRYKEFASSRFQTSRIVGKQGNLTDVYLQVPIMKGLINLWSVTRFTPARPLGTGFEVVEGWQTKGNLKDLHVMWTLRELSPEFTVLKCDLLLALGVPAPQGAVDEELRDAAAQAIEGVMDRAQGNRTFVPFKP